MSRDKESATVSHPGAVVVTSGPPGAGKSTVASLLADGRSPSVHVHTDDFWAFIRRGAIPPYLPASHRQNHVVMTVLAAAAAGYAAGGYFVVVDGVVGPWFISHFRAAAAQAAVPLDYAILRPDEATTLGRATARVDGALTEPQPVLEMYRQFRDLQE
jgi:predicted kinase